MLYLSFLYKAQTESLSPIPDLLRTKKSLNGIYDTAPDHRGADAGRVSRFHSTFIIVLSLI